MQQNRTRRLFYNNSQLCLEIGTDRAVTVFSISNTPLAQRSAKTVLLAVDSQSSIINHSRREGAHNLAYTAYGYSPTALVMGFTGQGYDSVTNCYLLGNGYRAFSPRLARFYSVDSLSPFTKHTHNAYAYCLGDLVNHHDPSGHMWRRANNIWSGVTSKLKKPRILYINKAREAIAKTPDLEKYSAVIDNPNVTKEPLKTIHRLSKGDATLKDLENTAVRNWRLKYKNIEGPINQDFDYSKYLDYDEQLPYIALKAKTIKYRKMLDSLTAQQPTTMNSSSQVPSEPSSPAAATAAVRGK